MGGARAPHVPRVSGVLQAVLRAWGCSLQRVCVCVRARWVPQPSGYPRPGSPEPHWGWGCCTSCDPGKFAAASPGAPRDNVGISSGQYSAEPWDCSGGLGGTGDGETPESTGTPRP